MKVLLFFELLSALSSFLLKKAAVLLISIALSLTLMVLFLGGQVSMVLCRDLALLDFNLLLVFSLLILSMVV